VKGDRATGFCPLPRHPKHDGKRHSPSFSANLTRGIFQCFGCGSKGNCLDFIAKMEGLNPDDGQDLRKAALLASDRFGIEGSPGTEPMAPPMAEKPIRSEDAGRSSAAHQKASHGPTVVNAPIDFELKKLDPAHPYLKERGFTPETASNIQRCRHRQRGRCATAGTC
jgi:DNA primase